MALTLDDIAPLLEGRVPHTLATASADGVPRLMHVPRILRLDERLVLPRFPQHEAAANLSDNPQLCALVLDPVGTRLFRLDLRLLSSETEGPVFERLSAELDAIATLQGMPGAFRIDAADVYELVALERVPGLTEEDAA